MAGVSSGVDVAIGTYDADVSGLRLSEDTDHLLTVEARFAYQPHSGTVTCLSLDNGTLASGSTDETVRIYDVRALREDVTLMGHQGTVNELQWTRDATGRYLLSGSDDGEVCIWRDKDWKCVKTLRANGNPVVGLAVHPLVRAVLSVAKEGKLYLWDLTKGRIAFSAKLKTSVDANARIKWAPCGEIFAISCGSSIYLYNLNGDVTQVLRHGNSIFDFDFTDSEEIITCGKDKEVKLWDTRSDKQELCCMKHTAKVRAVSCASKFVISGDTEGGLKIWDRSMGKVRIETKIGNGLRLTCMVTASRKEADLISMKDGRDME